jgi:hypothetical protein
LGTEVFKVLNSKKNNQNSLLEEEYQKIDDLDEEG